MRNKIENKGLVSVIIPVYNGYPSLKYAVTSLFRQTYPHWECVIVNDGSTDATKEYLDSLPTDRFTIHHFDRNKGRPFARQKALELARGEFISMLDADDIYHPEKLARQVDVMENNPDVYLAGAGVCSFGRQTDFIRIRCKGDSLTYSYSKDKSLLPVCHASSLLRRSHAIKFSYNTSLQLSEDTDFLRRYLDGQRYISLPDVLYYYSEFDSVTKKKIRKSYAYIIRMSFSTKDYNTFVYYTIKYLLACILHPFLSTGFILKRRGKEPTEKELREFTEYCLTAIQQ